MPAQELLLLSPRYTSDSTRLWEAACRSGEWRVHRASSFRDLEIPAGTRPTAIYGEFHFVLYAAQHHRLEVALPRHDAMVGLEKHWLLRRVWMEPLAQARRIGHPVFAKPPESKSFEPRVYASGAELPASGSLPDDEPVLLSDPVSFGVELRFFVTRDGIAACSTYRRNGIVLDAENARLAATEEEWSTARRWVEDFCAQNLERLPASVVLDVGFISGAGWALVEFNPVCSSGIYAAEPLGVLTALRKALNPIG